MFSLIVASVGSLPPDDTWHAFLSGPASSGFPQEYTWRDSPIRTLSKEMHTTLTNIISERSSYHIRTTDISYPDMFVWIINWNKQVLHAIITTCHDPHSATCRVKGQEWSDGKSLPTISDSHGASNDLYQPPVG